MDSNRINYITTHNLSVSYDDKTVLDSVNLEVYSDDFIGVIGPNGGGKTTLVKALLNALPYSGEIVYAESIMGSNGARIGYLPQINSFDRSFPISAEEVVLSGLQSCKGFFGRYTKHDLLKVTELLQLTGVEHLAKRSVGELSGGEFQRVILCRALISDPKLLILDEPNNFVDNKFEKELYELLKFLNERMAIIMVSHDLGTISSYIKSILCVNHTAHLHSSNIITSEQLANYDCPIQLLYHGEIPHTVLTNH